MSVYVTNGFKAACFTDNFFGKVNEIEVDNVYDNTIFYRAINEINEKKIEHYKSNDYDLSILKHCPTIKYISISGEATLNDLIGLENIRGIKIGLPFGDNESTLDMSRIKTLDGIENFPSLRYFAADYCKKLKSIKELACLKSLETLKISDCNGVEDLEETFSQLTTLKELTILTLETVAPQYLKSLSIIKEKKALQSFRSNYVIVDKDLTPLLRLKNAEIFEDKSYYKIKNKNLPKWDKK